MKTARSWVRIRAKRLVVLGAALVVALVFAGTAFSLVTYCNYCDMGPNGFRTTSGYNNRDWNRAAFCAAVSWEYKTAVGYYNTAMTLVHYSGEVWTNCNNGHIVALENNGYYKSRCWNKDTSSGIFVCQTDP